MLASMAILKRGYHYYRRSFTSFFATCRNQSAKTAESVARAGESVHENEITNFSKGKGKEEETDQDRWPRCVVSGLQPTGSLHVGNYFAAVRRCVHLQDSGDDLVLFIADLHALTMKQEKQKIHERSLELAAYLIASGVDPARSLLFMQSAVPRHAELCWLLACLATHARLAHLPQYKEKSATMKEAADILVYRGTHVPVGADQLQHLQVTSQLVRTFHHRFGDAFPTPRPLLSDDGSDRILSLRDPLKKMSKSDPDLKSRILLSDSDEIIRLKLRKAVTDFTPQVTFDPETRPGVSNLIRLHSLAEDKLPEEVVEEAEGLTTAQYKGVVADALCKSLRPIRTRAAELLARPEALHDALRHGASRARLRADRVYDDVTRLIGLSPLASDASNATTVRLRLSSIRRT